MADKVYRHSETRLAFYCPGCKAGHFVRIAHESPGDVIWSWNGSMDAPSFLPSLRVTTGDKKECHFNINEGVFIFHIDTTAHGLRGNVPMENWE